MEILFIIAYSITFFISLVISIFFIGKGIADFLLWLEK